MVPVATWREPIAVGLARSGEARGERTAAATSALPGLAEGTNPMAAAGTLTNAILLFAGNAAAAHALASALERGGHRITIAASEEEALGALEDAEFDLVLVHLHAPDPERLDVIKLLRMSDPSAGSPPVMVLADAMTAEVEQACADSGVDLRLVSPVEPRHLLDYVDDLLAGSRSA